VIVEIKPPPPVRTPITLTVPAEIHPPALAALYSQAAAAVEQMLAQDPNGHLPIGRRAIECLRALALLASSATSPPPGRAAEKPPEPL
jgi:hypothetical protein